jgi:hypothetical protein
LTLLFVSGLAGTGIYLWRQGSLPKALSGLEKKGWRPTKSYEITRDIHDQSAWAQNQVRNLLAKYNLKESSVRRTYNQEREEDGVRWLEDSLDIAAPSNFDAPGFLKDLTAALWRSRLTLMSDRQEGKNWVIELGDRKRVFQRVVFLNYPWS